jgi:hypothetical protein
VRIIDFVDTGHSALLRMWEKRQRGYRAMGYRVGADASDGEVFMGDAAQSGFVPFEQLFAGRHEAAPVGEPLGP